MLLLADRNFAGYQLWGLARATGAHLAWRIKKNLVFVPLRVLPDGSYLSIMRTPAENIRHGQARAAGRTLAEPPRGHLVRIIEYTVTIRPQAGPPRTETFRLVTSLLDHRLAPAHQLATAYHQRWEIENGFAELKNRLRGAGFILRSKAPELIYQEIYALLTVYQNSPRARRRRHPGPPRPRPDLLPCHPPRHQTPQPQPTPTRRHHRNHQRPAWPRRHRTSPRQRIPRSANYDFKRRDKPQPCHPPPTKSTSSRLTNRH